MPDTETEPGNPGTIAAVPLPNAQTPLERLACTHKHTHTHTYLHSICLLGIPAAAAMATKITATTNNKQQQITNNNK
jgi:hypothetical protein